MTRLHALFRHRRGGVVGLVIVGFMLAFTFGGPLFYHTDQVHTNIEQATLAPSAAHLLGTDEVG